MDLQGFEQDGLLELGEAAQIEAQDRLPLAAQRALQRGDEARGRFSCRVDGAAEQGMRGPLEVGRRLTAHDGGEAAVVEGDENLADGRPQREVVVGGIQPRLAQDGGEQRGGGVHVGEGAQPAQQRADLGQGRIGGVWRGRGGCGGCGGCGWSSS